MSASKTALVGVVVVTASCQSSPAPHRPEAGVPPQVVGSPQSFVCPQGFEFAAYGRLVYPFDHPLRPAFSVRPRRCFSTLAEAEAVGYRLAPPPPGGLLVEGVYLLPSTRGLREVCEQAAKRLRFSVPCPTLVPIGWDPDTSSVASGGVFVLTATFGHVPDEYVGLEPGLGHLNIWAVPTSRFGPPNGYDFCQGGEKRGTVNLTGRSAVWIICPEGSGLDGSHIDLRWTAHGVVYTVSLHGHSQANRALDLAIAEHVEMVK